MKITYFTQMIHQNEGVSKKIFAQVKEINGHGIKTRILNVMDKDIFFNSDYPVDIKRVNRINEKKIHFFEFFRRDREINKILLDEIQKTESDDIIYLRFPYPSLFFLYAVSVKRKGKIIIEHETIESQEYKLKKKYGYHFLDFFFGSLIRRRIDGIVGVTNEITRYQVSRSGIPTIPHITITNGFDVSSVPVRRVMQDQSVIKILCIANSVNKWHGFDRLLKGLGDYSGNRKILVYIIGEGDEILHLKELTKKFALEKQVIFTGYLSGDPLNDLFDSCHIAIGSMGIHRIGMTEACVLKVREYYSRGIPFVYGYSDPDIDNTDEYTMRIPDDESPVKIESIISFIDKIYIDNNHPLIMRNYALQKFDWSKKIKDLITFLETKIISVP